MTLNASRGAGSEINSRQTAWHRAQYITERRRNALGRTASPGLTANATRPGSPSPPGGALPTPLGCEWSCAPQGFAELGAGGWGPSELSWPAGVPGTRGAWGAGVGRVRDPGRTGRLTAARGPHAEAGSCVPPPPRHTRAAWWLGARTLSTPENGLSGPHASERPCGHRALGKEVVQPGSPRKQRPLPCSKSSLCRLRAEHRLGRAPRPSVLTGRPCAGGNDTGSCPQRSSRPCRDSVQLVLSGTEGERQLGAAIGGWWRCRGSAPTTRGPAWRGVCPQWPRCCPPPTECGLLPAPAPRPGNLTEHTCLFPELLTT